MLQFFKSEIRKKLYFILRNGLIQGLYFQNEKGPIKITAENNTEFFITSHVKLFKQNHSHTIFICKLTTFVELEGIGEIYLLFFQI